MGKKEKRERAQEKGKNASKSRHLKPVDSGRTNPPPVEPKVVTRNKECEHFILDVMDMADILAEIKSLKDGAACEECLKGTAGSRAAGGSTAGIKMCTECRHYFCSGLVGSHAKEHAKETKHWSSLWFDTPGDGYCFKCKQAVSLKPLVSAANAMAKKEKRARVQEMGKNASKSPRLKYVDSGRSKSPPPEPKVVASNDECEHFILEVTDMADILAKIESLKDIAACEECLKGTAGSSADGGRKEDPLKQKLQLGGSPEGRSITSLTGLLMCVHCQRCFCGGLKGSKRHIKKHSKNEGHFGALWFDQPYYGICFRCSKDVSLEVPFSAVVGVRGIPNLGNTCFANAVVQCLLVLGKLRIQMLAPGSFPVGSIGRALKNLFIGNEATVTLVTELLESLGALYPKYINHTVQDSQEFLNHLRQGLIAEEPGGATTCVDSIFGGQTSTTYTCTGCSRNSPPNDVPFYELQLPLPEKEHPTKGAASPQRSLGSLQTSPVVRKPFQPTKSKPKKVQASKSSKMGRGLLPYLEDHQLPPKKRHYPRLADSTELGHMRQMKDVLHGPLQTQEDEVVKLTSEDKGKGLSRDIDCDDKVEDGKSLASLNHCLTLYFREKVIEKRCEICSKDTEQPSTTGSKDGGQMVASGNATEGILISKLPPVLTVHLMRFRWEEGKSYKKSGHVSFEENLDVRTFVDPSLQDKDNSTYRLVGVVEHIGDNLAGGHYVAYVRPSHQQSMSNGSSSWIRASDQNIKVVSLGNVLECEAYLIFYERMDD
ncbi:hypothetical protein ACP4OV_018334 [Aristida adscensionis]